MEFRDFINELDKNGYLQRVTRKVHWKYEIGAIARKNKSKPLLFENIAEYPGERIFTGGLSRTKFIAMNTALSVNVKISELIRELKQRIIKPLNSVVSDVADENIELYTKDIDLFKIPVPWWNPVDGGRYIGTWHLNITKDPHTGAINAGVYRMQVLNKNQTTVSVSPHSHLSLHFKAAEKMGKDLQMAVTIGASESSVIAAAAALPYGTDEFSIAGAIRQKPLTLYRCRTVDIEVPSAEYVLEGIVKSGIRVSDGPYLDYAGKPSINPSAFVFEVKCITKKKDAIFRGMSVGEPGAEDHQLFSLLSHLHLVDFHGSSVRQKIQNILLKYRMFTLFQYSGRLGTLMNKLT